MRKVKLISAVEQSQRTAAKVVGLAYLSALIPAIFAEFYVPAQLFVYNNATETARNIMAHDRLFRLGIASNLITFAIDVVLITALYIVLKPVDRKFALLATFWRLIETTILVVITLNDFDVLRILSGADYLRVFETDQLQALARVSMAAHSAGYNVGLLFAGLGSSVFCFVWFRSNYVPRALAAFGVFSSSLLAVRTLTVIVFPQVAQVVTLAYYAGPIFVFELTMGFWLLLKGLRAPSDSG